MPAWEDLEPHLQPLYAFAFRISGDAHIAEEVVQNTCLRAWKKRRQWKDLRNLRVWLFRVAMNLWRDELRRKQRHREQPSEAVAADPAAVEAEAVLSQREDVDRATALLESLPPRQREALHLSAVEDLSVTQISEVLGCSANAVRVHLSQARKTMRACLAREESEA